MTGPQPSIDDRIVNEFALYYDVDEMPATSEEFRAQMSERADVSGRRLVEFIGATEPAQLSARLREIAEDGQHPVIHEIVRTSRTDWFGSAEELHTLQELLGAIAGAVDASAAEPRRG